MQRLLLLGLNHATAPVEVRERLAFTASGKREALRAFRARFSDAEAVLLSTCNRVELYTARAVHGHPRVEEMVEFLGRWHGVAAEDFRGHLYERTDRDVVQHLFSVASSLDSMVLGETQILGQVRDSYDLARSAGAAGAVLNPLFQRAIAVGKQVLSETGIAEGRLSIASVAVDYARRIFDHFDDKTVLSIGAGKMAGLVLQSFAELKPKRLLVCNRDVGKAEGLARKVGSGFGVRGSALEVGRSTLNIERSEGPEETSNVQHSTFNVQPSAEDSVAPGVVRSEALGMEELERALVEADVVVSSTGSARPIITAERFERLLKLRRYRPIFLIDIALPRDIEPAVGKLENVFLYDLDDLQQVVAGTQAQRKESIDAARRIVDEQVERYVRWNRTREMGPVIDELYRRHHALAQEELARTLNKLGPVGEQERRHLEELARRIVNKLLHDPIRALRESGEFHAPTSQYLHALEKLFGLEGPPREDLSDGRRDDGEVG